MSVPCSEIQRFADAELSVEEARTFQLHLASCRRCQAELFDLVHLDVLSQEAAARRQPSVRRLWRVIPLARGWIPVALAASLLVLAVGSVLLTRDRQPALLATAERRFMEARLSHPGASRFRPYSATRASDSPVERVPQRALADLEERGDFHGLATAYLLQGAPKPAAEFLGKAGEGPDVDSDRAVLALERREFAQALSRLEQALEAAPGHPQALWNRGLALRELGLHLASAEAFDAVAALNEPGWAEEARKRAEEERRKVAGRHSAWSKLLRGAEAMVAGGPPVAAPADGQLRGLLRLFFYDAVRAAPSRARVEELLPLAAQLDRQYGTKVLEPYALRVAGADFTHRAPLAEEYGRLATGKIRLDAAAAEAFLARVRAAGQEDIELGALAQTGQRAVQLERYRALAERSADPWFRSLTEYETAIALMQRSELLEAEAHLLASLGSCRETRVDYQCIVLELLLAKLYTRMHRLVEAHGHALSALELARSENEWELEVAALQQMGGISYFQETYSLGRAYLHEALLRRPEDCTTQHQLRVLLASMAQLQLDFATAAQELQQAPDCGQPPSLKEIYVLAELTRMGLLPEGGDRFRKGLEHLRTNPATSPAGRALVNHFEGRATLERDRSRGRELLEQAIAAADQLPRWEVNARKARAYSYAVLAIDAVRAGASDEALGHISADLGLEAPATCALALATDAERMVIVARGITGVTVGMLRTYTVPPPEPAELVPTPLRTHLAGCTRVEVLAQPPVQGQPRLLPPDLAWSYKLSSTPHERKAETRRQRVVVSGVEPPAAMGLQPLKIWDEDIRPPDLHLRGPSATPSAVLDQIAHATEIEFHVHGRADMERADAAHLVLSPDREGRFVLRADDIRRRPLRGAPLVILAACDAGVTLPWTHQGWSLPAAFLDAGARAVLASPSAVKDEEAGAFFGGVRQRIRAGEAPAAALQAERARWLARDPQSWAKDVLLFE